MDRKKDIGERVRKTVMKIMAAKTMRKFSSRLIFVSQELGRKNWDLCNWANPASHMNKNVLQSKEWQGEISET